MKWQDRIVINPNPVQNQNQNPNQDIEMIYVEPRESHIVVVTRAGVATREDQNTQQGQPQVRPAAQKKTLLDVQQEI